MLPTPEQLAAALPGDPDKRVRELVELRELVAAMLVASIQVLREREYSWRQIGELVGLPAQTARRYWAHLTG